MILDSRYLLLKFPYYLSSQEFIVEKMSLVWHNLVNVQHLPI